MSGDYRKPVSPKSPPDPRGPKVTRAEPPSERPKTDTGADPTKRARFAAQSAAVAAELDAAKRTMAITARVVGVIVLGLAIALASPPLSARARIVVAMGLSVGPWLAIFGNGGAASPQNTPEWFRWGLGTWALLVFGAVLTGNFEAWIAALLS